MFAQFIIIGNLGSNPEMRYTPNGKPVTSFSVAVNRKWGGDNPGEETTWFRVTCWGKLAEVTNQYLEKGRQVMVVADRIEASAYTDKKTGEPKASLEITAREVKFLGGRGESDGDEPRGSAPNPYLPSSPEDEEDLPF